MTTREQIIQKALSLNPEDRAYVVDVLEESLGSGEFASPATAAAWSVEIERRVAVYDRGEVQAAEGDPSLERMRKHLREHRAKKVARGSVLWQRRNQSGTRVMMFSWTPSTR